MHLRLQQHLLSLVGQSSSPQKPKQILSTQQPWSIATSRDQRCGKARGKFAKALEGLKMQLKTWSPLHLPPASVRQAPARGGATASSSCVPTR